METGRRNINIVQTNYWKSDQTYRFATKLLISFLLKNYFNFSNLSLNVSLINFSIYTHVFDCNHWLDFKNVILNSSKYKILLNPLDYYEKHGLFLLLLRTTENIKSFQEFLIKVTLKIFQTGIKFYSIFKEILNF